MTEDRATRASQAPHGPHTRPGGPGPHPAPANASQGRTAGRVVTGEEVPQDVLDAAQRGYSMHGAGLTANIVAAAWPAIEKHIRDRTPTGDRDQHSPAGRVWPVHGIWYWRPRPGTRCLHRSHRLRLPCLRGSTYDHQCGKHNDSCFNGCREAP